MTQPSSILIGPGGAFASAALDEGYSASGGGFPNARPSRMRVYGPGRGGSAQSQLREHQRLYMGRDCNALYRRSGICETIVTSHMTVVAGPSSTIVPGSSDPEFNKLIARELGRITEHVDHAREHDLFELAQLADQTMLLWGDGAFLAVADGRHQFVDPQLINSPPGRGLDELMADGIELESPGGAARQYWIDEWFGSGTSRKLKPRPIPAEAVAFFARPGRPKGMRRGYPMLQSVAQQIEAIEYTDRCVQSAYQLQAMFALISKAGPDSPNLRTSIRSGQGSREAGAESGDPREAVAELFNVLDIDDQREVIPLSATQPTQQYEPYLWAQLHMIGAAIGLPLEITHMRFIRNFSASRSAMAVAWLRLAAMRKCLARSVVLPLYRHRLRYLLATGGIEAASIPRDWHKADVVWPSIPVLDQNAWITSMEHMLNNRVMSLREALHERGINNFEGYLEQLAEEEALLAELGLQRTTAQGIATAEHQGGSGPQDSDATDSEPEADQSDDNESSASTDAATSQPPAAPAAPASSFLIGDKTLADALVRGVSTQQVPADSAKTILTAMVGIDGSIASQIIDPAAELARTRRGPDTAPTQGPAQGTADA